MDGFTAIIIIIIVGYIAFRVTRPPPPPPEPEKEVKKYELSYMDKISIELLKGGDPDEIVEREGEIDKDTINGWKDDFLKDIETYAKNRRNLYETMGLLENDVKWFEKICAEHIGEDWKEITGYNQRKR